MFTTHHTPGAQARTFLSTALPLGLKRALEERAMEEDKSVSAIVRRALWAELARSQEQDAA
jgi:predicted transcriptional regulator